jgi:DNA-binding CsgD family transcriptional regulator
LSLEEIAWKSRADELIERSSLTARQKEIARLLANTPLSPEEIANKIGCAKRTVDTHSGPIYAGLGIDGRQQLMWLASQ